MNLTDAALAYAAYGWPVLPLKPGTKHPLTAHGVKDATTDSQQIRACWEGEPMANIGVATGAAVGTVLDVDIKPWKNKHGDVTLAGLTQVHGALPVTLTQRTWSGGLQHIFRHVPGIKNRTNALGEDLDTRNDNGYIVVGPSTVTEDGREGTYKWTTPFLTPLAEMPTWMIARLVKPGTSSAPNAPGWADPFIDGVSEGTRDDTCYRLIGRYARLGLSQAEVGAFMLSWAAKCVPPFDEACVLEKIDRVFSTLGDADCSGTVEEIAEPEPAPSPWTLSTPPTSFISRYVAEASARTDAPADVHEALACCLLSALAGPDITIPLAVPVGGLRLLLWLLYLVNSTVGRKTTSLELAEAVLVTVLGPDHTLVWDSSPQALIETLQEHDGQTMVWMRDEVTALLGQINQRGGYLGALPQYLIRAYDGKPLENRRTAKQVKKGSAERVADTPRVERPYLALWWAGTWDAVLERLTMDNVLDGFLPRFAVIMGEATARPLGPETPRMRQDRKQVIQHARGFLAKCRATASVWPSPAALTAWSALETKWMRLAEDSRHPGAAAATLKRLSDMALKLAALVAIDLSPARTTEKGPYPTITLDHFTMAEQIVTRWKGSTLRALADLGRSRYQKDCDAVLATVRSRTEGMPARDVYRIHRHLRGREMGEVIDHLVKMERVELVEKKTSGRPLKWIRAR